MFTKTVFYTTVKNMSAIYTNDGVANVYANRTKMVCLFAKKFAFASFAQEVNGTSNGGGVLNELSIT